MNLTLKKIRMYYKLTNTSSEVYKKLHSLRTKEIRIAEENLKDIQNKVVLPIIGSLGDDSQQNLHRVPKYCGFEFQNTDDWILKIGGWIITIRAYLFLT